MENDARSSVALEKTGSISSAPQTLEQWYRKYSKVPYHQMDWDLLRILALREQKSYRQIAKDFKIARNTLRKYLSNDVTPARRPQPVRDRWRDKVWEILSYDTGAPDGQKATAKWIFAILVEKHGYKGSERTIRTLILEFKEKEN